jgi:uncharacterized membrane protein (UPF0127 family)
MSVRSREQFESLTMIIRSNAVDAFAFENVPLPCYLRQTDSTSIFTQQMSKKSQRQENPSDQAKKSFNKPYMAGGVFVVILLVIYFVGSNLQTEKLMPVARPVGQPDTKSAVAFTKQGELRFLNKNDDLLYTVDIEIADDDARRTQGLMYRDSMAENRAMLFILPNEREQSFWMKNTIMPLDIIYVNTRKQIVSTQKNAVPYSEDSIPSNGPAKYVVEVNAGFCDRHSIKPGDHVVWGRE